LKTTQLKRVDEKRFNQYALAFLRRIEGKELVKLANTSIIGIKFDVG